AEVVSIERGAENGPLNVFVKQRSDLGIAIGKAGCNIEKARILSRRFFGLDVGEVLLLQEEA
ncbi:NusA-like transcription termination signal-binding factor, partial [Candidatus Bathyarchaeota archaeon]|nr:NusA-like transcription termination signal-binding factor [Candidatus Bathyarchaeota archaeon]